MNLRDIVEAMQEASHKDAAILANYAAGVVVGKLGTSVCTKEELLNACGSL